MAKARQKRKDHKSHLVRFGHREIETVGLSQGFWTDLYHRSMTVYWPVFFGSAAAIFIALNSIFAFLYALGTDPIANVTSERYLELFYFSIETLATVGYGDMHPQTDYGHFIATVEIFTGMCFLAILTGMVFARFSRPRARFVFAEKAVIANREGKQTLMIRMANARHNTISRANARLWLIRAEKNKDGDQLRRFYELKLDRADHPMFALSWMLFHIIDRESPLFGEDERSLADGDSVLVLNVGGIDDSSAHQLYARRIYSFHDIQWGRRYVDITSVSQQGRFMLDYTKFNDTEPDSQHRKPRVAP